MIRFAAVVGNLEFDNKKNCNFTPQIANQPIDHKLTINVLWDFLDGLKNYATFFNTTVVITTNMLVHAR